MRTSFNFTLSCVVLSLGALALLAPGCATTPADRIAREQELFDTYPPDIQQNLRAGVVRVGYTEDMVRIALGKPDRTIVRTTESGEEQVLLYADSRPAFSFGVGGSRGGGRSSIGTGVGITTGGHVEERLGVVMRDGSVVAIEERTR